MQTRPFFHVPPHTSLIERRIVRRGREHPVPRAEPIHDVEPKSRESLRFQRGAAWLLHNPRFLFHLRFKLTRAPTGVAEKSEDRRRALRRTGGSAVSVNRMLI